MSDNRWVGAGQFSAGSFEVDVSQPHPCWVVVRYNGREIARLHHREIADLEHVIGRAKRCAAERLGPDADEL